MKVFYDKDCDIKLIKGRKVAIIGYGSQGHAHAQNLNDSGGKVTVGVRKGGPSWDKVKKAKLSVAEIKDAVKGADFVMMLMPDEHIAAAYRDEIEPHIKKGATLASRTASTSAPVVPRDARRRDRTRRRATRCARPTRPAAACRAGGRPETALASRATCAVVRVRDRRRPRGISRPTSVKDRDRPVRRTDCPVRHRRPDQGRLRDWSRRATRPRWRTSSACTS